MNNSPHPDRTFLITTLAQGSEYYIISCEASRGGSRYWLIRSKQHDWIIDRIKTTHRTDDEQDEKRPTAKDLRTNNRIEGNAVENDDYQHDMRAGA